MDMGMGSMIDLLIIACGVYLLYSAISMMNGGDIPKPLLPSSVEPAVLKEKKEFTKAVGKKTLILAVAALVSGAIDLANETWFQISILNLIVTVVFISITVWYCMTVKKLYEK